MNAKVCGFLVLVFEEFCVMEEGEECDVTTQSGGDESWDDKCLLFFLPFLATQFGMTFKNGNTLISHQYVQGKKKKKKAMKPYYYCLL